MTLHLLPTDYCFLLVLFLSLIALMNGLRREPTREALAYIVHKPLAACAGVVLLFFLLIGLLDSINFACKDTNEAIGYCKAGHTVSLLDRLLSPMGEMEEKTYSAPMSFHLFSSEAVWKGGHMTQVYPRLKFIPKSIQDASDRRSYVHHALVLALGLGFLGVVGGWLIGCCFHSFRFYKPQKVGVYVLLTLFLGLGLCVFCYDLSRSFHVLGTGEIGQDILYYTLKSVRTGLVIGILTTLFMLPFALFLGIAAGYFGGAVDDIVQYIYTTLSSIPGVLLITASVLSLQTYISNHPLLFKNLANEADTRLLTLCFILGITSWTSLCRLLRAETLKLKTIDFVIASKALGSSAMRIIYKHLLPNVMHIVLITVVLDFSFLVLAEAVLSYVGVGVSPLTLSWGNMINAARMELAREPMVWWPMLSAFILMFILVLSSNLFADAVRDAFDPHHART